MQEGQHESPKNGCNPQKQHRINVVHGCPNRHHPNAHQPNRNQPHESFSKFTFRLHHALLEIRFLFIREAVHQCLDARRAVQRTPLVASRDVPYAGPALLRLKLRQRPQSSRLAQHLRVPSGQPGLCPQKKCSRTSVPHHGWRLANPPFRKAGSPDANVPRPHMYDVTDSVLVTQRFPTHESLLDWLSRRKCGLGHRHERAVPQQAYSKTVTHFGGVRSPPFYGSSTLPTAREWPAIATNFVSLAASR